MQYDMVFEGGGAKGMAFVGALQELESRGHVPARLLGASAGAIMAAFLAAGYDSTEMGAALNETENGAPVFLGFLETPGKPTTEEIQSSDLRNLLREYNSKLIPDFIEDKVDDLLADLIAGSSSAGRLFSFLDKGGFYAGQRFLDWLHEKLDCGFYPHDRGAFGKGSPRKFSGMSLYDFHQATGVDLSLVASDTSDARILILNHRTVPQCPLVWAVRMSMSFPFIWQEVVWQEEWGTYRGRDITGHTIVDGGMLSNFPIELFISDQQYVTNVMGEKAAGGAGVLGLLIDEDLSVPGVPAPAVTAPAFSLGQLKVVQRAVKLINTMTQAHDKKVIDVYERYVIRLPARGFGTIEFNMDEARRSALVSAGRAAASAYFENQEAPGVLSRGFPSAPRSEPDGMSPADRVSLRLLSE